MNVINPLLARFAADLNNMWEQLCEDPAHVEFFKLFGGVGITLHADDGLTAKFWEEGIEFYPEGEA